MSIKIHHGPNGSYKTSGAIQDDAVPALREGRVIITNVRGFTLERVLQAMPDLPDSVDIINLSLESLDDMERMRTWFQWAPRGAFIIFDETQLVFPKAWREKDLERFDFPGGPEAAHAADRPMSWLDAWTRHRHFNWDVVLTTPNISYIRDDIRMTCEMAYRHANLAVIGIKGRYKESQHDAQQNRPPADGTIIEYKRIKPATFKLYQSTATGVVQDTKAGKNLLKSPKLLFLLVLLAALSIYLATYGDLSALGIGERPKSTSTPVASDTATASTAAPAAGVAVGPPVDLHGGGVAVRQAAAPPPELDHPFHGRTFYVGGVLEGVREGKRIRRVLFKITDEDGLSFQQSDKDLARLGYLVTFRGQCVVELRYAAWKGTAICQGAAPSQAPTPSHFGAISATPGASTPKAIPPDAPGVYVPSNRQPGASSFSGVVGGSGVTVVPYEKGRFLW